jgi:hypothetical protein
MSCAAPIDKAVLADYWLAELTPAEEESVEAHLLGCAECSSELEQLVTLANGIRRLARTGTLRLVVSQSFLDRLAKEGLRVRQYSPRAGGSVACTVTAEDDLLVGRLAADLHNAGRVDMVLCDSAGNEQQRLRDVPFDAARNEVIFNEPIGPERLMPAHVLMVKLVSAGQEGERVLGEYTFDHTPT